jgi:hypothetical protein
MTNAVIHLAERHDVEAMRPGWLAKLKLWFAAWVAIEEPEADPTASFSSREWADLPTHHPSENR